MILVDTHCHLDQPVFDRDREEVLGRAAAAGVRALVIPAIGPDRWEGLLALAGRNGEDRSPEATAGGGGAGAAMDPAGAGAAQAGGADPAPGGRGDFATGDEASAAPSRPRLVVGLGVHPQLLPEVDPAGDGELLARLDRLLATGAAVAVGECGLDGPAAELSAWGSLERQGRLLEGQLELARAHGLPVLLHVFRAQEAAVRILERFGPLPAGGVLHSYSGSQELVKRWSKRGLHFSFTGPVTSPQSTRVHAAVREVPEELLLVESDAPDQPPVRYRGERNEPAHLPHVVAAVAELRGMPVERVAEVTTANACRLFGLGEYS
jgi:TatD DNase family protein